MAMTVETGPVEPTSSAREPESDPARTLVILEMIFCDNESDAQILATYFSRFEITLASVLAQDVPPDAELLVTLHMSRDKVEWIDRVDDMIREVGRSPRLRCNIHLYDHPPEGYPGGDLSRVDWVKGPNKHSPHRERLFLEAHEGLHVDRYRRVLRVNLDDDDLWFPWHVRNLCDAARAARLSPEVSHAGPLALGILDSIIGYVQEGSTTLDVQRLKRTLTGQKFYVIDSPESVDALAPYSSLGVPERIDAEFHERFGKREIGLYGIVGLVPSFVYVRWGQNLSRQGKQYLEVTTFGQVEISGPAAALDLNESEIPHSVDGLRVVVPGDGELRVNVRRNARGLLVTTNLEDFPAGAEVCYYLIHRRNRADARWYSSDPEMTFRDAPPSSSVRAFVRVGTEVVAQAESRAV
ncbi:hypothetical protein GCM10009592_13510 [Brachybacterium rhamnosum]|uniref:Uncharacterized protein n=1 Tax=Brachybacterium rhamnosum TaxID=173361 RepID=A0ABW4PXP0_9MICO